MAGGMVGEVMTEYKPGALRGNRFLTGLFRISPSFLIKALQIIRR